MPIRIYIDTENGTWGDANNLVVVNLTELAEEDADSEMYDEYSYVAALESMSDTEIGDFGQRYGTRAVMLGG